MKTFTVIFAALFICVTIARPCYRGCSFKLCSGKTTIGSGSDDVALTDPICLPDGTPVANIASTGEAKINGLTKISDYAPAGLQQRFTPTFFKSFGVAIGHERLQQNQGAYIDNMCVALPILAYCTVDANKTMVNHVTSATTDCIALKVSLGGSMA